MIRRHDGLLQEVEVLTSRLFAEKQLAVALLAMTLVAHLAVAQFLLLRMEELEQGATTTPAAVARMDLDCVGGALVTQAGARVGPDELSGQTVVVHLDPASNACLEELAPVPLKSLVVGVPIRRTP